MEKYQNFQLSPEERAEDLLAKLSLDEKMAQTGCYFAINIKGNNTEEDQVREACRFGIGSVSALGLRELDSSLEAADWQIRMQKQIMEQSPHHIPAMFHMEALCGAYVTGALSLPSGINRGSSWDPEVEEQLGAIVSRQERACGITQSLAPVLDVSRDSRMGRQGETYGEDPVLAGVLGTAFTHGIQGGSRPDGLKAESVAKHFAGFHNSLGGIHGTESMTSPRLLQEIYMKPFQAAIAGANLRGIMPCYCSFDGETASSSKRMLTDILRDGMGFDGICCADYSAIENQHTVQGLYETMGETGYRSMSAGMDMDWPGVEAYGEELRNMFADGEADMAVLDRAVLRILRAKFRMGLFEHPYALSGEDLTKEFTTTDEDRAASYRSAVESMVLLKNEKQVLPLPADRKIKIALIGPHADNAGRFFGGYTHLSMTEAVFAVVNSMAGVETDEQLEAKKESTTGNHMHYDAPVVPGTDIQSDETEEFYNLTKKLEPECRTLLEQLAEELPNAEISYAYGYPVAGPDTSGFSEALELVKNADFAILTLGGKHGSCSIATMGEGVDASDINLPECQDAFIRAAAEYKVPLIGLHFNGRPISSDIADKYLNAILEVWSPSEMGAQAVADILTGKVNPSGKLPVSVARNAGQIPVFYNHPSGSSFHQGASIGFPNYVDLPHTPRYSFGYGLSYTTFTYRNLTLDRNLVEPDGRVRVSFDLTNTGKVSGCEVVQLYLKDVYASMVRPVMELAGFTRVTLKAGETKKVEFTISPSQTAFLDYDMQWKIEKGEILVMIGAASDDIRLTDSFRITANRFIEGKKRVIAAESRQLSPR